MWPRKPVAIACATVFASLYDLIFYPAIVEGNDLVAGEVWQFHPADMKETLSVLDEIEGYQQVGEEDLYIRRIVECRLTDRTIVEAYTYFFAKPDQLRETDRVEPDADGICDWPRG